MRQTLSSMLSKKEIDKGIYLFNQEKTLAWTILSCTEDTEKTNIGIF